MSRFLSVILTSVITIPFIKYFSINYNDNYNAIDNISIDNYSDNITCFPKFQIILLSFMDQLIDQFYTATVFHNDTYDVTISVRSLENIEQIQSILSKQNFTDDNLFLIEDFLRQFLLKNNWTTYFTSLKLFQIGLFLFCFWNFLKIFIFILKLSLFFSYYFKDAYTLLFVGIKKLFFMIKNRHHDSQNSYQNEQVTINDPKFTSIHVSSVTMDVSTKFNSNNFIDEIDNEPEELQSNMEPIILSNRSRTISEQSNCSTSSTRSTFTTISFQQTIFSPFKIQLPQSKLSYKSSNNHLTYISQNYLDNDSEID